MDKETEVVIITKSHDLLPSSQIWANFQTQNLLTVEVARAWRKVPYNTMATTECNDSSSPSLKGPRPFSQVSEHWRKGEYTNISGKTITGSELTQIRSVILIFLLRIETSRDQVVNVVLAKFWLTVGTLTGSMETAGGHFLSLRRLQFWLTYLAVAVITTLGFIPWSKS